MIVHLKNFMSHDESTFELPDQGLVTLTGPNGAGKSALIEAFAIAMWGRGARAVRWSPWRPGQEGTVSIEHGALSVQRKVLDTKKKLTWKLLDHAEAFDTNSKGQEALEQVIGSFDAWRRTCVFSSADAAHFTMATDAERKELLEELLGLGWFDRALTLCRKDLHSARSALGVAEHERDVIAARADEASKAVHQAGRLLAETTDPGDVGLLRAELTKLQGFLSDIDKDVRTLTAKQMELMSAGGESLARSRELKAKLAKLSGDECYTCGQEIPQALRDALQEEANAELKASVDARGANAGALRSIASQLEELEEEAQTLQPKKRDLDAKIQAITQSRSLRAKLVKEAESAAAKVLELGERIKAAAKVIEQRRIDVAELEACEKVLGVRGARALLVGRTLSGIEALANTWMNRLGSSIEITLRPYTEKKTGGTVDSISLGLTGAGGEAGYLGASAGERRRVDVAILLALAELADGATQGRRWRSPIFFDEVFDGLDDDGKEAVMELMTDLAKDRLVVLITHNAQLAADRANLRLRVDDGTVT